MNRRLVAQSKRLSWLLRHGASDEGLAMDPAGWVDVHAVTERLGLQYTELERIVRDNDKRRLQLAEGRIRACQGHSRDNLAVTLEALEASWDVHTDDDTIWHGTSLDAVGPIAVEGISAVARTHVHLAPSLDSRVGKRAAVHVGLAVSPPKLREAGLTIYAAPNGVLLVREVPVRAITGVRAISRRARTQLDTLRASFPLV